MDNLWTRRTNTGKLSLTTSGASHESSSRNGSFAKRQNADAASHGKGSFPPTPGGVTSPTSASTAFGLGSGAFASFGSAKTPTSKNNPFDTAMGTAVKVSGKDTPKIPGKSSSMTSISESRSANLAPVPLHTLKDSWCFWYRPPISKANGFIEYEHTLHAIATVRTAEEFWQVYSHLKRPSGLPIVSDYHLFKKDIRPIWEDEVNRQGGKWIVRLKKGVADRYWESLVLALIGDQFGDAGDDVCGVVLSVRNGEDILSIWTKSDGGRVLKARETMKHVLNFPPNTRVEFKTHDSSIQQRTAIDEQRREKAHEKRNVPGASRQNAD
ncbi:hypothetical protein N3K66_006790 [Trichothecium roseum]|uniref:Uncharacterized protein n=1 Tax=Trichothecium roseum TaxID=47278 RepID=A0ACC0UWA7_9HYPO|nr:hypothetical protein N3K66_006790 [Trichothecium roseum]